MFGFYYCFFFNRESHPLACGFTRAQTVVLFTFQILKQCFVGGRKAGGERRWCEKRNWKLKKEGNEKSKERGEKEEERGKWNVASISEYDGGRVALE